MKFENKSLNRFLSEWADIKEATSKIQEGARKCDMMQGLPIDVWIEETNKIFKLRQIQNSIMLDNSDGIKVRIQNKKKD